MIDFDRDFGGIDARALLRWGETDFVVGVNQERQKDERRGYENFVGTPPNQTLGVQGNLRRDESNQATTSDVYAQFDTPLSSDWQLIGGVRSGQVKMEVDDRYIVPPNGDDSGSLKFSYTNPVIGVRWRVAPQWMVHASVARGFESPTLGELAYRPDGGSGFNSGLQGQTSRQFELGSKWRGGSIDVDGALFWIDTENEIGVATNAGGRSSFQNVGRTRRYGAEAALAWRIAPGWRALTSVTLLDATYRDNFVTCGAPPCTVPNVPVPAGNRIAGTQRALGFAELAWRPGGVVPGEFAARVARTGRHAGGRPQQRRGRRLRRGRAALERRSGGHRQRHAAGAGARRQPVRSLVRGQRDRQRSEPALLRDRCAAQRIAFASLAAEVLSAWFGRGSTSARLTPTRSADRSTPHAGRQGRRTAPRLR